MKNINTLIAKEIANYEITFNKALQYGYNDNEEFRNDLMNCINKREVPELLDYYKICLNCSDNTNTSVEEFVALKDLILILEGVV